MVGACCDCVASGFARDIPWEYIGTNLSVAISLTTLVITMQAVEYLTRPKQIVYQKKQHTTRKSVR